MGMGWQIAAAAFGAAIGFALLDWTRSKFGGRMPWQITLGVWIVAGIHIYLGMLSISPNPPHWLAKPISQPEMKQLARQTCLDTGRFCEQSRPVIELLPADYKQ